MALSRGDIARLESLLKLDPLKDPQGVLRGFSEVQRISTQMLADYRANALVIETKVPVPTERAPKAKKHNTKPKELNWPKGKLRG